MTERHPRRFALLALALAALLAATFTGTAEAHGKKNGKRSHHGKSLLLLGGKTTLKTDPATTKVLLDAGIVPEPVDPTGFQLMERKGKVSARYAFPITGGMLDKRTLAGTIDHVGGINFVNKNNGKNLLLTNFRIVINGNPGLTAMVNNDPSVRVRILDLSLKRAVIRQWNAHWWGRYGFLGIRNVQATLTDVAAGALNDSLGVDFFAKGIPLGTAQLISLTKTYRGR